MWCAVNPDGRKHYVALFAPPSFEHSYGFEFAAFRLRSMCHIAPLITVYESDYCHNDHDDCCGYECAYHIAAQNHTDAYRAVTPMKLSTPHTTARTVR